MVCSIDFSKFIEFSESYVILQGIAIWFDCHFKCYEADDWKETTLSTGPQEEPTHCKLKNYFLQALLFASVLKILIFLGQQTVIPLFGSTGSDENVECDEIIGWELTLRKVEGDKNERQYAIQVEVLDPATTTQ